MRTRAASGSDARGPGEHAPGAGQALLQDVEVREADGRHALSLDGRGARTPGRNRARGAKPAADAARRGGMGPAGRDCSTRPTCRSPGFSMPRSTASRGRWRRPGPRSSATLVRTFSATAPRSRSCSPSGSGSPSIRCSTGRRGRFDARFALTAGVTHVEQPPATLAAVRAAVARFDEPAALAALSAITTLTGSAILALATAAGFLSAADAWRAAHVDEDFQNAIWGADEEAMARRASALAGDGGGGGCARRPFDILSRGRRAVRFRLSRARFSRWARTGANDRLARRFAIRAA